MPITTPFGNASALGLTMLVLLAVGSPPSSASEPGPDASLSPEEVVRIQLEALRGNDAADAGIEICFRFASPANKRNTGPLARFGRMIKDGVYRLMLEYREADYGPVELVEGEGLARQRVTLIGLTQAITYVFYLSRQTEAPCEGCWMTDAVTVERIESLSA